MNTRTLNRIDGRHVCHLPDGSMLLLSPTYSQDRGACVGGSFSQSTRYNVERVAPDRVYRDDSGKVTGWGLPISREVTSRAGTVYRSSVLFSGSRKRCLNFMRSGEPVQ